MFRVGRRLIVLLAAVHRFVTAKYTQERSLLLRSLAVVALSVSAVAAAADSSTVETWEFDDPAVFFALQLGSDGRCMVAAKLKRAIPYELYRQCQYSVAGEVVTLQWTDDPMWAPQALRVVYSGKWDAFIIDGEPNRILKRQSRRDLWR
jgi:hypothetical protein